MINRENLVPIFKEYKENGGIVSPMNTESCRKYLQEKIKLKVEPEDVLWLIYHTREIWNMYGRELRGKDK